MPVGPYPSLPITIDSKPSRIDGFEAVRASNGTLKMRKLMAGEKMEWDIEHELTSSQKTSLETHYQDNKNLSFTFTWPSGGSYTVVYMSAPLFVDQPGGWFKAYLRLGEV